MTINKIKREMLVSAVLLVISLVTYFLLIPQFVQENESLGGMSPRFFPEIGVLIIGFFSFVMLMASFYALKVQARQEPVIIQPARENFALKPLFIVIVFVVFIFSFKYLGYTFAAPATMAALMLIFGQRKVLTIVLVSALIPALLYVVFNYGLNLPLE